MELFAKFILMGFLFFYALNVLVNAFNIMYYIGVDANGRAKEEDDKKNMPESVKRLYS